MSNVVKSLGAVFGVDLCNLVIARLETVSPGNRVTAESIISDGLRVGKLPGSNDGADADTIRVLIERCHTLLFPSLLVKRGPHGGFTHPDDESSNLKRKGGKTVSAMVASLAAQGISLTDEQLSKLIGDVKANRGKDEEELVKVETGHRPRPHVTRALKRPAIQP